MDPLMRQENHGRPERIKGVDPRVDTVYLQRLGALRGLLYSRWREQMLVSSSQSKGFQGTTSWYKYMDDWTEQLDFISIISSSSCRPFTPRLPHSRIHHEPS